MPAVGELHDGTVGYDAGRKRGAHPAARRQPRALDLWSLISEREMGWTERGE